MESCWSSPASPITSKRWGERAALGGQANGRDRDHPTAGKRAFEQALRRRVAGIAESRHQHEVVGNEVVEIAGIGEAPAGIQQGVATLADDVHAAERQEHRLQVQ